MRQSCLKPDKELIEELCNKYGENVKDAVTEEESFLQTTQSTESQDNSKIL